MLMYVLCPPSRSPLCQRTAILAFLTTPLPVFRFQEEEEEDEEAPDEYRPAMLRTSGQGSVMQRLLSALGCNFRAPVWKVW